MDRLLDKFPLQGLSVDHLVAGKSYPGAENTLRVAAHGAGLRANSFAPVNYRTSFQYSFFISHASQVKTSRNSTTQIPRLCRCICAGSPT